MNPTAGPPREPTPDEKHEKATSGSTGEPALNSPECYGLLQQHPVTSTTRAQDGKHPTSPEPNLPMHFSDRRGCGLKTNQKMPEARRRLRKILPNINTRQHATPTLTQALLPDGLSTTLTAPDASAASLPPSLGQHLAATSTSLPPSDYVDCVDTDWQFIHYSGPARTRRKKQPQQTIKRPNGWNVFRRYMEDKLTPTEIAAAGASNKNSVMSKRWHSLSEQERQSWNERAWDEHQDNVAEPSADRRANGDAGTESELLFETDEPKRKRARIDGCGPSTQDAADTTTEPRRKRKRTKSLFSSLSSSTADVSTHLCHTQDGANQDPINHADSGPHNDMAQPVPLFVEGTSGDVQHVPGATPQAGAKVQERSFEPEGSRPIDWKTYFENELNRMQRSESPEREVLQANESLVQSKASELALDQELSTFDELTSFLQEPEGYDHTVLGSLNTSNTNSRGVLGPTNSSETELLAALKFLNEPTPKLSGVFSSGPTDALSLDPVGAFAAEASSGSSAVLRGGFVANALVTYVPEDAYAAENFGRLIGGYSDTDALDSSHTSHRGFLTAPAADVFDFPAVDVRPETRSIQPLSSQVLVHKLLAGATTHHPVPRLSHYSSLRDALRDGHPQ